MKITTICPFAVYQKYIAEVSIKSPLIFYLKETTEALKDCSTSTRTHNTLYLPVSYDWDFLDYTTSIEKKAFKVMYKGTLLTPQTRVAL